MKIEIRCPKENEMPQLLALFSTCCLPIHRKIFQVMEKEGLSSRYKPKVLFANGKIVSNVSLVRRDIYIGSRLLRGGGIAGVATHPDCRRRGYTKMLLKERLGEICCQKLDFSPLFTNKPFVYEKLGWEIFPQRFYILEEVRTQLSARKKNVEIFHHSAKVLIKEVKRIYEQNVLFSPGVLKRDEKYWQEYFRIFDLKNKELFFLLRERGIAKAYARILKEAHEILLGEMGAAIEDIEAIKRLLCYLLDWTQEKGVRKIVISLPPLHPIFEFLKMEDISLKEENRGKRDVLMINILSSKGDILRNKKIRPNFHWGYFDKF